MWNIGLRIFGVAGVIAGLLLLWNWLWFSPEIWNGTAARYKTRGDQLQVRVAVLTDSLSLSEKLNATKDSVVADISGRWQQAIAYGDKWKADLNAQYQVSDALAARLSAADREQANYSGLQQNGTLDKGIDPKTLTPADGRVVLANLQTVRRQAAGVKALDSVGRVIGVLTTKTDRMGRVLKRTDASLAVLSPLLRRSAKKAKIFGLINTKSSKGFAAAADTIDRVRRDLSKESELEQDLNGTKKP